MYFLSDDERRTLDAFCETIHPRSNGNIPADSPFALGASDMRIAELIERALAGRKEAESQERLKRLLRFLDQSIVNVVLGGHWGRFAQLDLEQRTRVLRALANSPFNAARGAFQKAKQLVAFVCYCHPQAMPTTFWPEYARSARGGTVADERLPIVRVTGPQTLTCDVLVIGSGAGGGVIAAELAQAGRDVIVAEKGRYYSDADFPNTELAGMGQLFERRGSLTTKDGAIIVLAGSTVGGGTTVNWMTCLRPPEYVLRQWADEFGFSGAASEEFQRSLDAVSERIHVTTDESHLNLQNGLIERGCNELSYSISVIPRNVNRCVECDFCSFGCRYGAKQDGRRTFLRDAVDHKARILDRAAVSRVHITGGRVHGATLLVEGEDENTVEVTVHCRQVVVAAGAIHTPALLIRSGLTNRQIGANLHLHPVAAVFARYPTVVNSWKGAPQTRVCEHFADLDGQGYGVRLEASPAHPGLWALGLPWQSGSQHKELMRQLPYMANTIIIARDKHSGHVQVDRNGQPQLVYRLHPHDAQHLHVGIEKALRIHRAAGAEEIYGPNNDCVSYHDAHNGQFESFLKRIRQAGSRPNHFGLFCAHQMSSCRIADNSNRGAVNPDGETYEVRNLFVADGSVFPTATGVNPMLTIMGTAHYLAQKIKARWPV